MGSISQAFPPPPTSSINWDKLDLKIGAVNNGHIESYFDTETGVWSNPKLVEDPTLRISGLSPALNYGQQCYEGMKAFRTPEGPIQIFRPERHAARMNHSASYVSLPEIPTAHFIECVNYAVAANAEFVPPSNIRGALYIRPLLISTSAHLPLSSPSQFLLAVYVQPFASYHGTSPISAVVLDSFDRAAPRGTGSAKIGGNYAPVMRWSAAASKEGFGVTLHLDAETRTQIEEFSTSGFLGVQKVEGENGEEGNWRVCVPDSGNVIDSITSASCLEVAASLGWEVERRVIIYSELPTFTEVLALGTAAGVVPISSIARKNSDGFEEKVVYLEAGEDPGPVCNILMKELNGIMTGRKEDVHGWCLKISDVVGISKREN